MTARAEQKEDQMTDEFADLHRPVYGPDLLITALERNHDKPALYLGDVILTGTPEGVGPLHSGDELEVGFNGLSLTTRVL